jgi:hypothetical protein
VKKSFTLSIDDKLLRAARKIALDRDTSVSNLVREYLTQLVEAEDRQKAALQNIRRIFKTTRARLGPITWTRDELHER